ncbi:head maturation protease, ClpP-related [Glaciimonas soli]|uniref:ATP-dependent Clp protease proteolytic subunit n=1 Tax=Glaciimonas soli TaxID=2590999 RepID=A0A843YYJ5_9BURK|nr:head maturation protease, ClpP-related [Glaciimonas soli]MQR02331.1 hypothetical protein [Glaciimonas soli]
MRTWYAFNNAVTDTADISIFDEIGMWGVTAKDFINDLNKVSAKAITLSINSPGGSVFDALAIFNALKTSGKEVTVRVMGVAASAASYIAMAGNKIVMPENTFMFLHNPIAGIYGNAEAMRDTADVLDKIGASLTATYVTRSGKSEEEVKAILAAESYLTAAECVEMGFADVIEPAITAQASFAQERLPENVRAIFMQAKQNVSVVATPPTPAMPFVEQIHALASAAGFVTHAAHWALDASVDTLAKVQAIIAVASEIKALCILAKQPDTADQLIRANKTVDEVRTHLCTVLAVADERTNIDTALHHMTKSIAPTQECNPALVNTADIWAKRRLTIGSK